MAIFASTYLPISIPTCRYLLMHSFQFLIDVNCGTSMPLNSCLITKKSCIYSIKVFQN